MKIVLSFFSYSQDVYTGSQDGSIYIYDKLTGEIVKKLCGHTNVVRDVSWHPSKSFLFSSSWDGGIIAWDFARK
jgi:DDB1- and CUL4-associated factor 11